MGSGAHVCAPRNRRRGHSALLPRFRAGRSKQLVPVRWPCIGAWRFVHRDQVPLIAVNGYHDFVFDTHHRRFIGRFEEMYKAEQSEHFDSWDQDNPHRLDAHLVRALVDSRNPRNVVDIGCGKGFLTSLLAQPNRTILGCDVSETALSVARERNPLARLSHLSDSSIYPLVQFLFDARRSLGAVEMVVVSQVLSYISDWKNFIDIASTYGDGLCLALYLPADPIGHVKSWDDVTETVARRMDISASLWDSTNDMGYLLATR